MARGLDIPFCVAGGIRTVREAEAILNAGAEKISVNSPALADPPLIDALAKRFGSRCVVVGIGSHLTPEGYRVYQFTGDPNRTRDSGRDTLEWAREVQERDAGEIVLNCMGSDGVKRGYDIEQLQATRELCSVPLVASGGAGAAEHFRDVFKQAGVDAALAAVAETDDKVISESADLLYHLLAACRTWFSATRNHGFFSWQSIHILRSAALHRSCVAFGSRTMSSSTQNAKIFGRDTLVGSKPLSPTGS